MTLRKTLRKLFPKRQKAFVQADDAGDLHNIRLWAKPKPKNEEKKP